MKMLDIEEVYVICAAMLMFTIIICTMICADAYVKAHQVHSEKVVETKNGGK